MTISKEEKILQLITSNNFKLKSDVSYSKKSKNYQDCHITCKNWLNLIYTSVIRSLPVAVHKRGGFV